MSRMGLGFEVLGLGLIFSNCYPLSLLGHQMAPGWHQNGHSLPGNTFKVFDTSDLSISEICLQESILSDFMHLS